ncbi:MAG TPA: iron uptake transporter permease EfeU [Candidatus Limnocylindrales bacterium]|nr:iron uptake transporter permease EfeU [Candidatus Limnocylindrales bacterium]
MDLGALTAGFVTGLREGVEAALVVAIVLAYLVRSGASGQFPKVWAGVGVAAIVSLAAGALIFATVGSFQPPYENYFEAGTLLVATVVVTWMLFWMRRQSMAIRGELHARLDRVLAEETGWGLAVLAFTSIIREGLETSIFLVGQTTSAAGSGSSIIAGALIGLVAAIAIGWTFYTGSRRIDLRAFFRWTGIGLIFIAAGLISHAVHELIEAGVLTFGAQPVFDISKVLPDEAGIGQFLRAILGYSAAPEATTLAVYLAYLIVVLALYLRPARPVTPPSRPVPAPEGSQPVRS